MAVNWNIGIPQQDVGQRVLAGMQLGTQVRQQNELLRRERSVDDALRGIATNPNDPNSMNALIQAAPRIAIQMQQQQAAQRQAEEARVREAAQTLGPVYQHMSQMPYEQRRAWLQQVAPRLAQRGIPLEVIANYDPTDENLQADMALSRQASEAGFTLGEGQVRYDAQGNVVAQGPARRPRYYPIPPGGDLRLDPSYEGPVQEAEVTEGTVIENDAGERMIWRGGQWVPAEGGAGRSGPQTFPAGQ